MNDDSFFKAEEDVTSQFYLALSSDHGLFFFTLSINNKKKTLYRYDTVHTLQDLQITCFSHSCFLKVRNFAAGQEWKMCHEPKVACSVKNERMLRLSECYFRVVHIFVYCRMFLGYKRLLAYFFPKNSTLEHGQRPISLCANLYSPENSQPMFWTASTNEMKQVSSMEVNYKEHWGTKQRKFSWQLIARMFNFKEVALHTVYHRGHPTYLQFSLIFDF